MWIVTSPLIVISQNKGGAYIVSKLNRSVFDHPIAAFWVIPYFTCQHIKIPPLDELIDISAHWLHELENSTAANLNDDSNDLTDEEDSPLDLPDGNKDWGQSSFQLGGETYTIRFILLWTLIMKAYFSFFRDLYFEFRFHLGWLFTCSQFTFWVSLPFQVHTFMASVNFPLFAKMLPWHNHFRFAWYLHKCHKAEVLWLWWITLSLSSFNYVLPQILLWLYLLVYPTLMICVFICVD